MAKTGGLCTRLLVVLEHVVVLTDTFIDLLGLRIMRLTNSSLKPSVVVLTILEILLVKLTNRQQLVNIDLPLLALLIKGDLQHKCQSIQCFTVLARSDIGTGFGEENFITQRRHTSVVVVLGNIDRQLAIFDAFLEFVAMKHNLSQRIVSSQ
jgi:hypothetical protein